MNVRKSKTPGRERTGGARSRAAERGIVPCNAYMAITALEMERFRRETERGNLMLRLNSVHAGLRTMKLEKAALARRRGRGAGDRRGAK